MNKEFIPYEQALELKELGFDEECLAYYDHDKELKSFENELPMVILQPLIGLFNPRISAPLYQQAFRWFREKYEMFVSIESSYHVEGDPERYYEHTRTVLCFRGHFKSLTNQISSTSFYDTYEEAELACLKKLIEIAKNK